MVMKFLIKKLTRKDVWHRVLYERLTEPLHLNLLSLFFTVFGSYRKKIEYDLIVRPQHAFSILKAADHAKRIGIQTVSLLEFGVATGAGLLNIAEIANRITKETGVKFKIYGFDTGHGMPPAKDYRDHPELYQAGDYNMDVEALQNNLPPNVQLILGNIDKTVHGFLKALSPEEPIGFISVDLDYYSSSKSALQVLNGDPAQYLPITFMYFDDIFMEPHNNYCGELLAINEFNTEYKFRKIEYHRFLESQRIFRKARWIKQIYYLHVLDHSTRSQIKIREQKGFIDNPYLT